MGFKIFLDANILLDLLLKREKYDTAKQIMQFAIDQKIHAYTTPSVIHITAYWLTKAYDADIAKKVLLQLLADVNIIDCTHQTTINALSSNMKDIEDALQYYTAINHKIDVFISRDKGLKQAATPSLPVLLPEELLNNFE